MKLKTLLKVLTECHILIIDSSDYTIYEGQVDSYGLIEKCGGLFDNIYLFENDIIKDITVFGNALEIRLK